MSRIAAALTAAAFLVGLLMPTGVSAQVVLECDYFNFQEQAQSVLDNDPADPYLLDEDGDGVACNDLPAAGTDPEFPALPESGDYRCVDFPYQEMAQEILDEDDSDPYNLDPTGDGVACSLLPLQADNQDEEAATGNDENGGNSRAERRAAREAEQQGTEEDTSGQNQQGQNQNGQNQDGQNQDGQNQNAEEPADDSGATAEDDAATDEEAREARRAERQAAREAEQNAGDE